MDAQKMSALLAVFLCILLSVPSAAEGTTRRYQWVAKRELTPPGGYRKQSITINGRTPGPTISAYQGDKLIIEVTNGNALGEEDFAIQFDGVRPVIGEGWTDPIRPRKTFAYQFFVDRLGDCPYYARSTLQKEAGLSGSIRVSPPYVGKKGAPFEEGAGRAGQLPPHAKGSGKINGTKSP